MARKNTQGGSIFSRTKLLCWLRDAGSAPQRDRPSAAVNAHDMEPVIPSDELNQIVALGSPSYGHSARFGLDPASALGRWLARVDDTWVRHRGRASNSSGHCHRNSLVCGVNVRSLLVAIQVASAQLTSRIIATTLLRDNVVKYTVGLFIFTLLFWLSAQNRMESDVNDLVLFVTMLLGIACFAGFFYLIDHASRLLRPIAF